MSLSICLLTRNAEPSIARALASIASLGAQVIVGDTGSTDATAQTARGLGAEVVAIPWQDDFGAAQNLTLAHAKGEWVLWLNPDEELLPQGSDQLADLLARPDALAYVIRVQEMLHADQRTPGTETWQPRLFRRRADLGYVGRLHPQFMPPLEELARRENKQIYRADLIARRHAYLSVLTVDKLHWATRLLELELRDRPGQLHYLIEYGRHLLRLGDPQGHAVLAEASEQVFAAAEAPSAPSPTVALLLEYLLTVSPAQSQSRLTATQASILAKRWFPNSPPLVWLLALAAFQAHDFRAAAAHLERLVYLGQTGTYDHSAGFDPSIMGESALLNLGLCHVQLGDLDKAEECYRAVLVSPSQRMEAEKGLQVVETLKRRLAAK